jgi:hypothetical protein
VIEEIVSKSIEKADKAPAMSDNSEQSTISPMGAFLRKKYGVQV